MRKKMMILATMAASLVAFAAPSMANATGVWTDGTVPVEGEEEITFSGTAAFTGIGGVSCASHSSTTLTEGSTGDVDTFTVANPAGCTTSGALAGCTVTSVESTYTKHTVEGVTTPTPWIAHTTTDAITITHVHIDNTLHGAFCPYHEITLTGDVIATPNNKHAASSVTLSNTAGALKAYNGTTGAEIGNVTASGTLNVSPAGTYGIT